MSYPYLGDLIRSWFGIDLPLPLPMFGLFVAAAMLVAGRCLRLELERLQRAGLAQMISVLLMILGSFGMLLLGRRRVTALQWRQN